MSLLMQGFLIAIWVSLGLIYFRLGFIHDDMKQEKVETNIFDEVEIHNNCTVQILKNTETGEVSIGWWDNEMPM